MFLPRRSGLQARPQNFCDFCKKAVDSAPQFGNLSFPFDGDRTNRFAFFPSASGLGKAKTFPSLARPEQKRSRLFDILTLKVKSEGNHKN